MTPTTRDDGSSSEKAPARLRHVKAYAESRGWTFIASGVIIAGQTWLSHTLGLWPQWLFPVVSAVLLVGSVMVYRLDLAAPSRGMRLFAGAVVGVLALADAFFLVMLVRGVFVHSTLEPPELLLAGLVLWVVNIAVFALAYWEVDGGGPEDRARDSGKFPDLVFPQQQSEPGRVAPPGWAPGFADYLYVSLTASTAFSPTDAMPFTKRMKLLMALESTISFAVFVMLVARAVNVAKG